VRRTPRAAVLGIAALAVLTAGAAVAGGVLPDAGPLSGRSGPGQLAGRGIPAVVIPGGAAAPGRSEASGARSPRATQDVEVLWDRYGVPHIFAADPEGLGYAFGWAQMQAHGNLILRLYGEARG
jgi:acyl-homoserine lactone acylase PvdQ